MPRRPPEPAHPPVVLVFAGTDPTGGAGIAADVLALASLGCHPAPVVTAVTAQDTRGIKEYSLVEPGLVIAQARAVLEDMPVAAVKLGMLGSNAHVSVVASILNDYPDIPLIVDPVQASNLGDPLADEPLSGAIRSLLAPRTLLMTPNGPEARALAPDADSLDACAQELMALGCAHVLITGTHEATPEVVHHLYGNYRLLKTYSYARLPADYHGSGCTLASACAAGIAHGLDPAHAVAKALDYTWESLRHGMRLGMGQLLPDRLYWARSEDTHPHDA